MLQPLQDIINLLRKHKLVRKHQALKAEKWTKSCFVLLSSLIQDELQNILSEEEQLHMGTMVSYKTLQSIFQGQYNLKFPIDPRSLNTLNKIVRFLGFEDWNQYHIQFENKASKKAGKYSPKNKIKFQVRQGVENAFKAIHNLSTNGTVNLKQYFQAESPAFNKIAEVIEYHKHANNTISNQYNPSSCEILECKVKELSDEKAQVYTKEYWLLCWWNKEQQRYVRRYKQIGEHYYILEKCDDIWKICNDASMSDLYDSTSEEG